VNIAPPVPADSAPHRAMALLASGVPLSLLLDLALGPRSEDLLEQEPRPMPAPRPA
jgi:hypothetical protein